MAKECLTGGCTLRQIGNRLSDLAYGPCLQARFEAAPDDRPPDAVHCLRGGRTEIN
jgi:hypothetical protein